jgi:Ca2+-binding RTX toxin-like protein
MTRLALKVGLLVALVAVAATATASPASAAVRYVAPDGVTDGECTDKQQPCEIEHAIENRSQPGDEVIVAPGDYPLRDSILVIRDVYVHGADGQPRPRIFIIDQNGDGDYVITHGGSHVRYLALETPAIDFSGVGEDLVVNGAVNAAWDAVLRDSVVIARGDGISAVRADAQHSDVTADGGQANLRNVTAIATGTNSVGIEVTCDYNPGGGGSHRPPYYAWGDIVVKNSIARGTFADINADGCGDTFVPPSLDISYSNFRTSVTRSNGMITTGEGNQTNVDPLFVDAGAGDFHQMPTSPTIDAGIDDPLLGAFDIDGQPRSLGMGPDIGADEAPDADADGYPDGADNCRQAHNQSQADRDRDGKGDACDRLRRGRCANLVLGTAADDGLLGTDRGDRLRARGGDDTLKGRSGADCLGGGAGSDALTGNRGNDRLVGGSGRDGYRAGRGNDRLVAADGEWELVDCGRGRNDRAVADRNDLVTRCERVRRK